MVYGCGLVFKKARRCDGNMNKFIIGIGNGTNHYKGCIPLPLCSAIKTFETFAIFFFFFVEVNSFRNFKSSKREIANDERFCA